MKSDFVIPSSWHSDTINETLAELPPLSATPKIITPSPDLIGGKIEDARRSLPLAAEFFFNKLS